MTGAERERLRTLSGELVLVVLAALDAWSVRNPVFGWNDALLMVAVLALPLRNRAPLVVFAIALVVAIEDGVVVIPTVAMYAVAVNFQRVIVPLAAGAALAGTMTVSMLSAAASAQETPPTRELVSTIGYSVAMVGAPLAFGRLVRARRELAAQLAELTEAQDDQRRLHEHNVLSRERAQLAREMHDVVSHQVSLIAVEAGALQVTATDEAARESARSVRRLAVSTLDELRHMVGVLRASGTEANGLAPQPTAGDLPQLIATSGLSVNLVGEVPGDLSPAVARAVYRTTQEALTNARKHAPGAGVEVTVEAVGRGLRVRTENSRPTRVALDLPGSKVGLLGLRERAESLGERCRRVPLRRADSW